MKKIKDEIDFIDVHIIELPGRGKRVDEKLLYSIDEVIEDIYLKMAPLLDKYTEFYIFGHSMGAILAYLISHRILQRLNILPSCIFVSGRGGPSFIKEREKSYHLPSIQFKDKLRKLGGCPEEVLINEDLMRFFEPILRADFQVIEDYDYKKRSPLNSKIVALFGTNEELTYEEVNNWQLESIYPVEIIELPGNHFFLFKNSYEIAQIIKRNSIQSQLKN
jgi:external thioesterase TEII